MIRYWVDFNMSFWTIVYSDIDEILPLPVFEVESSRLEMDYHSSGVIVVL